jgi:hypothetical protein
MSEVRSRTDVSVVPCDAEASYNFFSAPHPDPLPELRLLRKANDAGGEREYALVSFM